MVQKDTSIYSSITDQSHDSELVRLFLDGDEKSFEAIVSRYLHPVFNFVRTYLKDDSETEDATQETFLKVWKNIRKFDRDKNFKVWVFSIARNTCIDVLRKKKEVHFSEFPDNQFEDSITDEELLADELFEKKEHLDALMKAYAILNPPQKEVLFLYFNENLNFREIGEVLKEPIDTIKSRYRRALLALHKLMLQDNAPKQ